MNKLLAMLAMLLGLSLGACVGDDSLDMQDRQRINTVDDAQVTIEEDGEYTDPDAVAAYLNQYNRLPDNYITKAEAESRGWVPEAGNLWAVAEGKSIGGEPFNNQEDILPDAYGRRYFSADVNYDGGYRGAERLVYSNDGLIFYTPDHYDTFILLYGDEDYETHYD